MFQNYRAYINNNPSHYWFRRKLYGWGWTPATWQGWLVIAIFLVIIVLIARSLPKVPTESELTWFFARLVLAVSALLLICWRTGESPRWQWGTDKK